MNNISRYTRNLRDLNQSMTALAGGKGANLGELCHISGINVPPGFCITTDAWHTMMDNNKNLPALLEQLSQLTAADTKAIADASAAIRFAIEHTPIPQEIVAAIEQQLQAFNNDTAFAVRSSATAEDLPSASFAGQQDTYLNISGTTNLFHYISKCWASLYTDRAIIYRLQNNVGHRQISMAVIVQQMIQVFTSGILFTADPLSSNRKVVSIDAGYGLGEAFVSGIATPDNYRVKDRTIISKQIASKERAIAPYPAAEGGTGEVSIPPSLATTATLTDDNILLLEQLGRKIEAHFGQPQDIEWCADNNQFYIVQSRPITTLFPIPATNDHEPHAFISVGHNQMMTDAMKPLGLSFFLMTTGRPMYTAAGRLFVDVAADLAVPARRNVIINTLGRFDPLIKSALQQVMEKPGFIKAQDGAIAGGNTSVVDYQALHNYEPAVVDKLISNSRDSINNLKDNIHGYTGIELFDFILGDIKVMREDMMDQESLGVILTGMNASSWINDNMYDWLGEKNVADTLAQSAPNNITSEMGLALLDVADSIRPYPAVISYLQQVRDDNFLEQLPAYEGGQEVKTAVEHFLERFGMRGVGEIDITRTRWLEKPATLIPLLLSNIRNFPAGESTRKFEQGKQEAHSKEAEILERLQQLPDGEEKVRETKRMTALVRTLVGYREYPKYAIVNRYWIYKQALLQEAVLLQEQGVIQDVSDIYYFSFQELREVVATRQADTALIAERKADFKKYEKLTPPRVMTSDGEIITGTYKRENLPANAIVGMPVSAGIVEGRARVILQLEDANPEEGDILITTFTDPSWTPVFVGIKGLITEVGGLMTHGAVIAREYGLPAIVGAENATKLIKDGQRIRLNGTEGYIELL
ncbi:phosphoenolpyruvate synthase [Chitinophaga sp. Cy-1792]|uniref:phosphoenolpyruvate synthase n=1 Tax=Chitinophaga sp. Cy-1792 TaxID=2608339 RepID=UPI00142222F1|nr:phosphoenolpyruvate synthase [Chitinophaga sp. Cy-1792]NIG55627.1 phosphoenolpyruvate synthase [Chitinophaga sp. Cy-1792]